MKLLLEAQTIDNDIELVPYIVEIPDKELIPSPFIKNILKDKDGDFNIMMPINIENVTVYTKEFRPIEINWIKKIINIFVLYFELMSKDYVLYQTDWFYWNENGTY